MAYHWQRLKLTMPHTPYQNDKKQIIAKIKPPKPLVSP